MPDEKTQHNKSVKSCSDVLIHKKISTSSYSSGASESSFFVPEVEFISTLGNDSTVDTSKNCENQPLLGRMQCDLSLNIFSGLFPYI